MKKYVILVGLFIASVLGGIAIDNIQADSEDNSTIETSVIEKISVSELSGLYSENYQFVDIRTTEEYQGLSGSEHLSMFTINLDYYEFSNDTSMLDGLDKDVPVVIICNSGNRSNSAATLLKSLGFSKIYDVQGGMVACSGSDSCEV